MRRMWYAAVIAGGLAAGIAPGGKALARDNSALIQQVIKQLNDDKSVGGREDIKCYKTLFDAYLQLSQPPTPIGPEFNLNTIHPRMANWNAVRGWSESNTKMAQAILRCKDPKVTIIGLPYGKASVSPQYQAAGLFADVGVNDSVRSTNFAYQAAVDTIAAYVTAEVYRLMEAGQNRQALDLAVAYCFVQRLFCDREFLDEKLHSINLLSSMLSNVRDVMYVYADKLSAEDYARLSLLEIPLLRPDRGRLFMPEADRIVSEALIKQVFDERTGGADEEKFTATFAAIQAKDAPLTRFGAAKRWRHIALIHGSREASLERLKLIYDDWWRRWRIDAYDDILNVDTEFERTNPIRYAAVIFSLQDMERLFSVRNRLVVEVNGTAAAAGLCAYRKTFSTYPNDVMMTYTQFLRKRSDSDPYDKRLGPFGYMMPRQSYAIDTDAGRLQVESGQAVLYSLGQDHSDDRAAVHTDDGSSGDIVIWPPIKSLQRASGLLQ